MRVCACVRVCVYIFCMVFVNCKYVVICGGPNSSESACVRMCLMITSSNYRMVDIVCRQYSCIVLYLFSTYFLTNQNNTLRHKTVCTLYVVCMQDSVSFFVYVITFLCVLFQFDGSHQGSRSPPPIMRSCLAGV